MLCRLSSEFLRSSSPGIIAVTCGTNLHPCWSTVTFAILGAPLALGTETTALARPLLEPTTTFSITASVPHFSVSLLTLRSEEHTSELQSHSDLVCRLLLEKKKYKI